MPIRGMGNWGYSMIEDKRIEYPQPKHINPERLHEELTEALGNKYISIDTGQKKSRKATDFFILLSLTDDATDDDKSTAGEVIRSHKPDVLSVEQKRKKAQSDADTRFRNFDFNALEAMKPQEQMSVVIGLLKDIQKLLQRDD